MLTHLATHLATHLVPHLVTHIVTIDVTLARLAASDRIPALSLSVDLGRIDWSGIGIGSLIVILLIPVMLVGADLFWFSGRCPKGGPHEWEPHERGAGWIVCPKCKNEDF